jgi:hypothetical protein
MLLEITVPNEYRQFVDEVSISNAINAAILGKTYELEEKVLFWQDLTTDQTFPYLLDPVPGDSRVGCHIVGELEDVFLYIVANCSLIPEKLVESGIATYFEGLKKSEFCELAWRYVDRRQEFDNTVETRIFPRTREHNRNVGPI